jgi:hypothetical protein
LIVGIIGLAKYTDEAMALYALLNEWNAITDPWGTEAGFKARADVAIRAGRLLASITPTTADDTAIEQLAGVVANPQIVSFILSLINRFGTPEAAIQALDSPEQRKELEASAAALQLDLNTIWQAIQLILKIIEMLRGTTAPASDKGNWDF